LEWLEKNTNPSGREGTPRLGLSPVSIDAAPDLKRNRQTNMSTPDQMYDEAQKLKAENNMDGAIKKLQEIVQIAPNHSLSHSALSVYLQRNGRPEEAIQHAIRVTEIEPNDPFSFTQLSVIYVRCGKIQEAEDAKAKAHMLTGRTGHH
jgi:Flp pilus assembly protein TadD